MMGDGLPHAPGKKVREFNLSRTVQLIVDKN